MFLSAATVVCTNENIHVTWWKPSHITAFGSSSFVGFKRHLKNLSHISVTILSFAQYTTGDVRKQTPEGGMGATAACKLPCGRLTSVELGTRYRSKTCK
jgi:hypothetical protein